MTDVDRPLCSGPAAMSADPRWLRRLADAMEPRHRSTEPGALGDMDLGDGFGAAAVLAATGGLPVDLPMITHLVGIVTPTCELTRGSTAIVRGEFALAWRYNPASFVVGFGLVGSARTAIGIGRWMYVGQRMSRSQSIALAVSVATIIAVFWVFQQTEAEFIIGARY